MLIFWYAVNKMFLENIFSEGINSCFKWGSYKWFISSGSFCTSEWRKRVWKRHFIQKPQNGKEAFHMESIPFKCERTLKKVLVLICTTDLLHTSNGEIYTRKTQGWVSVSPLVKIRCDHKTSFQACDWSAVNIPGPLLVETDFYSTLVISDGVADWLSHCQTRFCDIFYQEWFTYLLTEIMYHNQRWSLFFWTFKMDKWKDWQMWGSVNDIEMWFFLLLLSF